MVKRLIIRVLVEALSTLGKSALKAYRQSAQKQGAKATNPFTEYLNSAMQSANLAHRPMTKSEAVKILHLEGKEVNPESIYKNFWVQFHKNDPTKGGSFYLQSMYLNARNELMKEFPGADEKEILKKLGIGQEQEQEQEQKDEKKENQ